MQETLAVALVGMQQDMQRLDRIASNLANAATPGHKREVVAARSFGEVVEGVAARVGGALEVRTDARPGTVRVTGQALDVAITGDGFLEVMTDAGPAYTRQGDLRLDAHGRLVTAQGHPVMGRDGEITLATRTPVIDASGNVTEPNATTGPSAEAPGTRVAQLKVVRFEDAKSLERLGDGLVAAGRGMAVLEDGHGQLRQGALENANVTSTQEMVQLIQTMRHFESMQKVAQGYDDMLGVAIRKIGELG